MLQVKRGARPQINKAKIYKPLEEPEIVGLIQGSVPMSTEEWYVAVALDRYKIEYQYQVPLWGGFMVRGGQVVDFIVNIPWETALQIMGERWHSGKFGSEDEFKVAQLRRYFNRDPILISDDALQDQEQAYKTIYQRVVTAGK